MDSIDLLARHVATTNRFDRSALVSHKRKREKERERERDDYTERKREIVHARVVTRRGKRLSSVFACSIRKIRWKRLGRLYQNVFFHRAIRTGAENDGGRKTTATIAQFRVNLIGKRRSIGQGTNQTANRTRCDEY